MTEEFLKLVKVVEFTNLFSNIQRDLLFNGSRVENDSEHSFQLAIVAWYLQNAFKLKLDTQKLICYALIHDLVEAYAGDVSVFDEIGRKTKDEQEKIALEKIKSNFAEFTELVSYLEKYYQREDLEAKFVYALDKILPDLNVYLDDGNYWQTRGRTFGDWTLMVEKKSDKINSCENELLVSLFSELRALISQNKEKLF